MPKSIIPENIKGVEGELSFQTLAENTPIGIYRTDASGNRTYVNKTWREITGRTEEEAYGTGWANAICEADRQIVVKAWKDTVAKKTNFILEFRFDNPTKGLRWVRNQATPLRDEQGVVTGYIGSIEDITQQKIAEQKLLESEKRYRLLSENSTDLILLANAERKFIYVSPSVREMLGYVPEELAGSMMINLIHPDDRDLVKITGDKIRKGVNEVARVVVRMKKKNDEFIWVESQVKLLYDEDSKEQLVQASIRDINESQLLEEKLKESERIYRLLSENSYDIISLADQDRKFEYVSPAVREVLGYEPEELIGISVLDLVHPDDFEHVKTQGEEVRKNKLNVARITMRMRKKNGDYSWVESQIKIFKESRESKQLVHATIRDINDKKQLEDALKEAKEKAEEASKAKSMFLSTMSHEIRTPMNAIIGLTNLMIEENPREDQIESLNLLKFSGENLLTIINDILDFNKIEAGKVELEEVTFNLKEIISYHINLLRSRATDKGIELKLELQSQLPDHVIGDPVRLGQVLNNLISNAIKFTEKGFVLVTVNENEPKPKDDRHFIHFSVKDTGIGIKNEKLKDVFENFTQASKDTTRKYGGTGLGLSISQKLVQLMGSEIKLESQFGTGSAFSFDLWMKEGRGDTTTKVKIEKKETGRTKGMKVLLVDDNKVNQVVAGNFLKKWGMVVSFANDGHEACEMVAQNKFDLVLMDLQMPEMDGYQATEFIRAMNDPYYKTLPILALTASALLEEQEKADSYGFNGFITKPFQPKELKEKIVELVSVKQSKTLSTKKQTVLNFDEYTLGNEEMKKDLMGLFIENLKEIKTSLQMSLDQKNNDPYLKSLHKNKTTLAIINDIGFNNLISKIHQSLIDGQQINGTELDELNRKADELINLMEEEIQLEH